MMVPVWKSLKFWQAISVLVATAAVQFGWLSLQDSALVLAAILGVLRLFDVVPELRDKGLLYD